MILNEDYENKNKKAIVLIISVICFIIALIIAICLFKSLKSKKSTGMPSWGTGQKTVSPVKTIVAQNTDLFDYVVTNGDVETQTSIEVYPSIGGKIVQMNVSLGSYVKKDQIIAYIDPSEPGTYYAKSPVTAPISGSILTSPLKLGQKVSVSSAITKIGDTNNLQITAKIPERYVAELKIGQKAEIVLEAYPEEIFHATVSRISPVLDASTRTKEIILTFTKNDSRINAGMFANVKLYTTVYGGHPVMLQDSLVTVGDEYFIYVVNQDCTVTKRQAKLGKNIDGQFQILEGLEPGEVVVTEGMLTLYDGASVKDLSGNVVMPEQFKEDSQSLPNDKTDTDNKNNKKDKKDKKSK